MALAVTHERIEKVGGDIIRIWGELAKTQFDLLLAKARLRNAEMAATLEGLEGSNEKARQADLERKTMQERSALDEFQVAEMAAKVQLEMALVERRAIDQHLALLQTEGK